MKPIKFQVNYDDSPHEVVSRISALLIQYGLTIEWVDGATFAYDEFEIIGVPLGYCQECGKPLDKRRICHNPNCDNYIKLPKDEDN